MGAILNLVGLGVTLDRAKEPVPVIDDLSLAVGAGRTLALVGESGCGKSMTALAIMGLMPAGFSIPSGRIVLEGRDIAHSPAAELRHLRGNRMSMIFQEPMTALNPVYTIGDQIGETLMLHQGISRADARKGAVAMLRAVRMPDPERRVDAYPCEMSGGMRQRVMIAMALACRPRLLIADEPTTALDVTVQAQIFDLLRALQQETGTAILLITHDLEAVADIADDVAVLYAGRCVERGPVDAILDDPCHPYTQGLIASMPRLALGSAPSGRQAVLSEIPGIVPDLGRRGQGCAFAPRCSRADARCGQLRPSEAAIGTARTVACWHPGRGERR